MSERVIHTPQDLGPIIRAVRKAQGLRQDDAAGSIGVSENFLAKIERGGLRVQFDKLLLVLEELGIELVAHYPSEAEALLNAPKRGQAGKRARTRQDSGKTAP